VFKGEERAEIMSLWDKARQATATELDWRTEWSEIAFGTLNRIGPQPKSVSTIVEQLDQAYKRKDCREFRRLKEQLESQPSWDALLVSWLRHQDAITETSTETNITPASRTLWDASTDSSSPSK
jgi:hypothetical protein